MCFETGKVVLAVYFDLRQAFETIDMTLLVAKLGLWSTVLKRFEYYLNNRHQKVKFKKNVAGKLKTKVGVPHGIVLGPILFHLFEWDIKLRSEI